MKQSIIIPYHNDKNMIKYNVKTLVKTVPNDVEIIIIGNNYNNNELEVSFPYKNCKYYAINENLFYPKAINYGVKKSSGDIITFCDPDIVVTSKWYEPLLDYINKPNVGAVSSKLINPCTGRIIDFGMYYSRFNAIHSLLGVKPEHPLAQVSRKVQSACSAIMMTKRVLFDMVGGMNNNLPYAYTDMDYCLKLKEKGYETWVVADSEVYHKGNSDKSNSKSYAFNYLNADSKALFYADNYNRFVVDFDYWFKQSWNHFRNKNGDYPLKYVMLDFSTIYNKDEYYDIFNKFHIIILDRLNVQVSTRDSDHISLHKVVPFGFIDLCTPILYFVDTYNSLFNNTLWFKNRDISRDIVIDRHGNICTLSDISSNIC